MHELDGALADYVDAQQLPGLAMKQQLHKADAVADDLAARQLAIRRLAGLVRHILFGQFLFGLTDERNLRNRVDAVGEQRARAPSPGRRRDRRRTAPAPLRLRPGSESRRRRPRHRYSARWFETPDSPPAARARRRPVLPLPAAGYASRRCGLHSTAACR